MIVVVETDAVRRTASALGCCLASWFRAGWVKWQSARWHLAPYLQVVVGMLYVVLLVGSGQREGSYSHLLPLGPSTLGAGIVKNQSTVPSFAGWQQQEAHASSWQDHQQRNMTDEHTIKLDFYELLELDTKEPTQAHLKSAYHKAALKHHPDRGGTQTGFQRVKQAFDVLSDSNRKHLYDTRGEDVGDLSEVDPFDLLSKLFGGSTSGGLFGGAASSYSENCTVHVTSSDNSGATWSSRNDGPRPRQQRSRKKCRFGAACSRQGCHFYHPAQRSAGGTGDSNVTAAAGGELFSAASSTSGATDLRIELIELRVAGYGDCYSYDEFVAYYGIDADDYWGAAQILPQSDWRRVMQRAPDDCCLTNPAEEDEAARAAEIKSARIAAFQQIAMEVKASRVTAKEAELARIVAAKEAELALVAAEEAELSRIVAKEVAFDSVGEDAELMQEALVLLGGAFDVAIHAKLQLHQLITMECNVVHMHDLRGGSGSDRFGEVFRRGVALKTLG